MATRNQIQICCLLIAISIGSSFATVVRSCEGHTLTITCSEGNINIKSANYGRTAGAEICPHSAVSNTNCYSSNSLSYVQSQCDGRSSCAIYASNSVFGDPCVGTYKYLEVDYECTVPCTCDTARTCEHGTVSLSCSDSKVLYICDALYGRKFPGSVYCPHSSIQTTNCEASSSLSVVQAACQGKTSCSVSASNSVFSDPCVNTYKYLEVEYRCAKRSRVCEHSSLSLSCPSGQVIQILDGFYGRMAGAEICPHSSIKTTNCKASSSMSVLLSQCDGKRSCTVSASNSVFGDPCVGTYKYLEVFYDCCG